jgi:predicted nucleic acid-binding protein
MNGNKIFVDTNILVYFLKGDKEVIEMIADKDLVISFITELELLSLPKISEKSKKLIKELLNNCLIIDLNNEIKELTIEFRKKSKLKLPDSIIGASAYFFNLPLLTADKQFKSIDEIEVLLYEL